MEHPDHENAQAADVPSRREFCTQACKLMSFAALSATVPACAGSPTSPSAAPALPTVSPSSTAGAVTLTIDAGSPLAAVGSAAIVQTSNGTFLVGHTSADAFTVLTSICTHEACTISGFSSQQYVCPCHGSVFDLFGRVLSGPATIPLRQFPSQFANGVLTITV